MREQLNEVLADRYQIERELGRGGMASVWLARDLRHGRSVAIKVIHPDLAGAIGVDRFVREIRLTAALQHPNIVSVLDSGTVPGPNGVALPWYVMPYVAGESLRSRLEREGQLPIDDALGIAEEAAAALDAAHRQGIVHRDIKPENLLLADGHVYVADFGIAKALIDTGTERLTSTGIAIGTPAYMSPEQATASAIDARSDQYALASVLYEMLTGEPPFTGPTAQAVVARRMAEPARSIRPVRSSVSPALEAAVLRGLERVPADRFPDVAAFAAALRKRSMPERGRSRPWRWAALVAGVFALAGVVWLRFAALRASPPRSPDPEVVALYRRGARGYDRRTAAGIIDAIAGFAGALKRDSTYAPAWNGLAKSYVRAYERLFPIPGLSRDSVLRLAVLAVDRALAADSGSADAWLTQALVSRNIDPTDDGPVLRALRRAVTLDSTDAAAWHFLALALAETGDFDQGLESWRRSVAVGPSYTQGLSFYGLGEYWRRRYDRARVWADSAVAIDPNYLLGRNTVGYIAVEQGDYARAIAEFEAARRLSNDVEAINSLAAIAVAQARAGRKADARATMQTAEGGAAAYTPVPSHLAIFMAQGYAELGDPVRAVSWLARYETPASLHFQLHLRCDPPFDRVANDPRFLAMLTRPRPAANRGC